MRDRTATAQMAKAERVVTVHEDADMLEAFHGGALLLMLEKDSFRLPNAPAVPGSAVGILAHLGMNAQAVR
jgi:hypothetical protein